MGEKREREKRSGTKRREKEEERRRMEEVAWRPCRRVPRASLTAAESMRFPSLRVVNNGDGDDNEAIYRHALAHVLPSTFRPGDLKLFREFARSSRAAHSRAKRIAHHRWWMKDLDRSASEL